MNVKRDSTKKNFQIMSQVILHTPFDDEKFPFILLHQALIILKCSKIAFNSYRIALPLPRVSNEDDHHHHHPGEG